MFDIANLNLVVALAAISLSIATGILTVIRDFRALPHRLFAIGMAAFAAESLLDMMSGEAELLSQAIQWQEWALSVSAIIPVVWVLFSFTYARLNSKDFLDRWKWLIAACGLIPILLVSAGRNYLFSDFTGLHPSADRVFPLGWAGTALHVLFLLSSVLVLANLERTLRTSYGAIRWRIKFLILGVGSIFATRIYISTQVLLFSSINAQLFSISNSILIAANILIIIFAVRSKLRETNLFVSQDLLYSSLTILVIGIYLLTVGIIAKLAIYLGVSEIIFRNAFIVFVVLLGMAVLVLSTHVRFLIRRFVHRHFQRPFYDYRKIWTEFSQKTASIVDLRQLCGAITKMISEVFLSSAATIWLIDGDLKQPVIGASTTFSPDQKFDPEFEKALSLLIEAVRFQPEPLDLAVSLDEPLGMSIEALKEQKIRYCARLAAGGEFVGILTINSRTGPPFSMEDFDLMKIFADQTAVLVLNNKLFESFGRAKEMQAFKTLSAFFVHDLKNIASTLSLTLQNLPVHYDKPEFRKDALKMILRSREKIQGMCTQLSVLNQKFELQKRECDLNAVVSSTLANIHLNCEIAADLKPLPPIQLDSEQIQKVVLNLVLNANESGDEESRIRVETCHDGASLVLSVIDNGCGMSREFITQKLFRPFMTTKDYGSGIGLYQCKLIIEAHGGRIEVQSKEGEGSTFRVVLPLE